ncbi:MAG: tetratricopeptide repeat protein [Candidatus Eremiobacteraeota bacterium]|nr:tetratricopeptide repeat protein [Candidatus Eremiobacteraeota bacterium]
MKRPWLAILLALIVTTASWADKTDYKGEDKAREGVKAYQARHFQESVKLLKSALDLGVKERPLVLTILGNAYDELEDYEQAIASHKQALREDPKLYQGWTNLGVAYRHVGDYDSAEEAYQKALELKPDYAELHASLGALYIYRKEPKKAIASLEKAIELDPKLPVAYANISLAYAMVDRFEEAEEALDQAVKLGYRNGPAIRKQIDGLKADK